MATIIKKENRSVVFQAVKGQYQNRQFNGGSISLRDNGTTFDVREYGQLVFSFEFSEIEYTQIEPAAAIDAPATAAALLTLLQEDFFFKLGGGTAPITPPSNPIEGDFYFDGNNLLVWNGEFWQGAPVTIDDFFGGANGDTMIFTTGTTAGGAVSAVGGNTNNVADLNGVTLKARFGFSGLSISSTASSGASLHNSTAANLPRYKLSLSGGFFVAKEWRQRLPVAAIDFANDPTLACVGLVTFTATTTVNPTSGIYFRMPRLGETQFVKYVVREGGAETVFSTAIPFSSSLDGYVFTGLIWDGANDTMHFITQANSVVDTKSITSFSTTYPTAFAAEHHFCTFLGRNGAGASPYASIAFAVDKAYRYTFPNYLNCI